MKTISLILLTFSLLAVSQVQAKKAVIDTVASTIMWTGKKVGGQHQGTINLKSGELKIEGNSIEGGTFIIDMNSIKDTDLTDPSYNAKLVGHLKSDDFFSVEKFPEAKFVITKTTKSTGNQQTITGNMTIKGITHPVSFEVQKSGNTYEAHIIVDRSKYNVRYGSNSFFDNLGNKVIDNNFLLDVTLAVK